MTLSKRFLLVATLLAPVLAPVASVADDAGVSLLERLHTGGLVIFLRNGRAVLGAAEEPLAALPEDLQQACAEPTRVLTKEAAADMRRIASQIKRLGIPIARVLTSPACRAVESAWYAFGNAEIEPALTGVWDVELQGDRDAAAAELMKLLTSAPGGDGNLVIVSHVSTIRLVTDLDLNHGEAAIFEPAGGGKINLLQRVMPDQWSRIATAPSD